jgi:hypothetical protein
MFSNISETLSGLTLKLIPAVSDIGKSGVAANALMVTSLRALSVSTKSNSLGGDAIEDDYVNYVESGLCCSVAGLDRKG